jgi:hypothetical protein
VALNGKKSNGLGGVINIIITFDHDVNRYVSNSQSHVTTYFRVRGDHSAGCIVHNTSFQFRCMRARNARQMAGQWVVMMGNVDPTMVGFDLVAAVVVVAAAAVSVRESPPGEMDPFPYRPVASFHHRP